MALLSERNVKLVSSQRTKRENKDKKGNETETPTTSLSSNRNLLIILEVCGSIKKTTEECRMNWKKKESFRMFQKTQKEHIGRFWKKIEENKK